jgi:hypothetical protein
MTKIRTNRIEGYEIIQGKVIKPKEYIPYGKLLIDAALNNPYSSESYICINGLDNENGLEKSSCIFEYSIGSEIKSFIKYFNEDIDEKYIELLLKNDFIEIDSLTYVYYKIEPNAKFKTINKQQYEINFNLEEKLPDGILEQKDYYRKINDY